MFKVVVNRGNVEYLAFEEFFGCQLDDYGKGFNHEDECDEREDENGVCEHGYYAESCAQRD